MYLPVLPGLILGKTKTQTFNLTYGKSHIILYFEHRPKMFTINKDNNDTSNDEDKTFYDIPSRQDPLQLQHVQSGLLWLLYEPY